MSNVIETVQAGRPIGWYKYWYQAIAQESHRTQKVRSSIYVWYIFTGELDNNSIIKCKNMVTLNID